MTDKPKGKKHLLNFAILFMLAMVLGCVSMVYPFGRDQGIYAYAGQMLLEGKINYKYVFDLKPPGIHYIFAFAELVSGKSMINIRIFDIIWQAVTVILLFQIIFNLTRRYLLSAVFSILYAFLYFRYDYWHTLQADGFLNLPFALSVLLLLHESGSLRVKTFFSGILLGGVLLFKYTFIVYLPLILFVIYFNKFVIRGLKYSVLYFAGITITILVTVLVYLFTNSFSYFYDILFIQIPKYAGIGFDTSSADFIFSNIVRLFFGSVYSPFLLLSLFLLCYLLIKRVELSFKEIVVYVWLFSALFNLIIQWKFFLYHFLVIIPPLLISSAVAVEKIILIFRKFKNITTVSLLASGLLFLFIAGKSYPSSYSDLFRYISGQETLHEIYAEKGITADSAFMISNTFKAIDFVRMNTSVNDKIYVWGFDPLIYYLTPRKCVSRFIYNYPLYWRGYNEIYRQEFLSDIRSDLPKMILIARKDALFYISGFEQDSEQILEQFPEFKKILESEYYYLTNIDNFIFYKLNKSKVTG